MWFAIFNIILSLEMSSFVKYERSIIRINVSMYINENMKELLQGIVVYNVIIDVQISNTTYTLINLHFKH